VSMLRRVLETMAAFLSTTNSKPSALMSLTTPAVSSSSSSSWGWWCSRGGGILRPATSIELGSRLVIGLGLRSRLVWVALLIWSHKKRGYRSSDEGNPMHRERVSFTRACSYSHLHISRFKVYMTGRNVYRQSI
jgi:hypothetical protein